MKYCRRCKSRDKYQIKQPVTIDSVADFVVHQIKSHGLVDIKFSPGDRTPTPEELLVWINSYHKMPRKMKKAQRRKLLAENF